MASKAYVVAMTVSELKDELKQRGLSTKGSKTALRDRLEQVKLYFQLMNAFESPFKGCYIAFEFQHSHLLGFVRRRTG